MSAPGASSEHHRHRRPRAHGGVVTTLPWRRAPLLLTRRPVVFAAIVVAAAILTMAAASGPLFLSTVGTASLNSQAEQSCPQQSRPGVSVTVPHTQVAQASRRGDAAMRSNDLPDARRVAVGEAQVQSTLIHLFASAGALDHVTKMTRGAGPGVWVPDDFAHKLAIRPGGTVTTTDGARMRVAGIYRSLAPDPFSLSALPRYWCSWNDIIVSTVATDAAVAGTPPERRQGPLVITDPSTVARVVPGQVRMSWHSPMSTKTNPLGAFDAADRRARTAAVDLAPGYARADPALPRLARAAHSARDGIAGTVVPIEVAGVVIAGLLVGGAGMFWANARRREIRLLVSRGVGPGALAGKAVLETLAPAAVGAALGFGGTLLLVRGVGPAQVFESGAPLRALGVVAGVLVLGLALIGVIGALAGRERTVGRRRSWSAHVPWELALIAAALAIAIPRLDDAAVTVENNVVQVSPLVILYPLLGATGALLLLGRLLGGLLPAAGRATRRGPVTAMLALRRMSRSRAIAVGVIIGTALPCCLLMYGDTVRDTVSREVTEKYRTNLGAPHVLQVYGVRGALFELHGDGTQVVIYDRDVTVGDEPATVLGVDPKTFDDFASTSGAQRNAVGKLGPARAGKVPAIVVNAGSAPRDDLRISRTDLTLDPVATSPLFPGLRDGSSPLVVVDQRTLGGVDDGTERSNQVWTSDAGYGDARRLIAGSGYSVLFELSSKVIVESTGLLPVTWVFGYLRSLAVLIGVVAIAGLVFGLASRTRHRRVSYVLSRRMGMSRLTHVTSLLLELGTVLGLGWVAGSGLGLGSVGVIYERLDVYPDLPPPARFVLPSQALLLTVALAALVVVLTTLATQWLAERTRPAEILRLE